MNTYKKRSFFSSARYDLATLNRGLVIFLSGVFLAVAMFVRWVSGNPLHFIHSLGISDIVPPVFFLIVMFSLFYILAGIALSLGMSSGACCPSPDKYRGGMYFFIMLFLSYAWYPIFFCANLVLISLAVSILCLLAGILASACFSKVSTLSFLSLTLCNAFLAYLVFLNMRIFFSV